MKKSKHSAVYIKKSFLGLVSRSFVISSLIIIFIVVAVFLLSNYFTNNPSITLPGKTLLDYGAELKNGKYYDIPVKKLFGTGGFLHITDTSGNLVYSSAANGRRYTLGELDCIQNYDTTVHLEVAEFDTGTGSKNFVITKTFYNQEPPARQYMLVSSGLRIISSTIPTSKVAFTENEFRLFTFNFYNENQLMYKTPFTTSDGGFYYAVFLDTLGSANKAPDVIIGVSVTVCALLFIIWIVIFLAYIKKKFRQPLAALDEAMSDFAGHNYRQPIKYSGYTEFEQLFDSFDNMVGLLDSSEKERERLAQDKQRMLAGLSHDLKTPITVIQGFSKAIRDGLIPEEEKQKYLEIIINKSDRMIELINALYEYNKLDHPDFEIKPEIVNFTELTRAYLARSYGELELQGFELLIDIAEEPLYCMLDRKLTERVYDNLISNILKYNPAGTRIFFGAERTGENVKIIIADDGVGIDEDIKRDIFKPFVVGDESRNKNGTGLGLAICEKIVLAHKGTISLSVMPAEGFNTQFEIFIPVYKPNDILSGE